MTILDWLKKEKGNGFKANWTGAWDTYTVKEASMITVNRGNGFEKAIKVKGSDKGYFIYFEPFKLEQEPDGDNMLLFFAKDAIYVKE